MSDFEYPFYPILALIASALVVVPLPWNFRTWNTGVCLLMVWLCLGCLTYGVNAIVWHADAVDRAPGWCDISSRIVVGIEAAVPAASLCITHRLYKIASVRAVSDLKSKDRVPLLVDLAIALGIPISQIMIALIVSGHRYDIYEQVGCYPFIPNTALAFPLVLVWPVVISFCSVIYCGLSLLAVSTHRTQFDENLLAHSSLTFGGYFRLLALAIAVLLCTTPIAVYNIVVNAASPSYPWSSVAAMDLSHVDKYPAVLWKMSRSSVIFFELNRWSVVLCAVVVFAFLEFAEDAREYYLRVSEFVVVLSRRYWSHRSGTCNGGPLMISVGSLPVYYAYTMPSPNLSVKGDRPPRLHLDFESTTSSLTSPPTAHTGTFRSSTTFRGYAI